ncbi:MAG: competence protein CoiA [Cytophagaceae bacterium]|jgi:hypothetical protein|nr:competence protein CoiA [Cytophagaceae bacterium]
MIKYQYAIDENKKLVNIDSLNEENRNKSKFFCIGCGNELIAKLGKIKIHHFAHKKEVICSGETYLHLLGKQLFYDNYIDCLTNSTPFYIELYQKRTCNHYEKELGLECRLEEKITPFDLTKYFDNIELEAKEDSFIADILLTNKNNNDKMFVEIAVTHLSTEQKLNSNYRIIELKIEREDDFEPIKRKCLSIKDPNIKFKNFKTKDINTSRCNGNCQVDYNFLTLDKDGRCLLKQKNLKQIKHQLSADKEKIVDYVILMDYEHNYSGIFKTGVAEFAKKNLKIRNCFICRYHAENNSFEDTVGVPIFCKFLKLKCNSNQAVTCEYFRLEKNYVNKLLIVNQRELEDCFLDKEDYYNENNE